MRIQYGFLALALSAVAIAQTPAVDEQAVIRMARTIQREILTLPEYGVFDHLRFSIKGDTVILRGQASRPILKSSAENVTKRVEGVAKVDNQIEVLPLSPADDQVRLRTYVAIYGHPTLSRFNPNRGVPLFMSRMSAMAGITNDPPQGNHPVHILVKNGNVTLEGVLPTAADRTIAEIQANGVFGSFSVINNVEVEEASKFKKPKK
jgi:hyperosmotically inducible protein